MVESLVKHVPRSVKGQFHLAPAASLARQGCKASSSVTGLSLSPLPQQVSFNKQCQGAPAERVKLVASLLEKVVNQKLRHACKNSKATVLLADFGINNGGRGWGGGLGGAAKTDSTFRIS